MEHSDILMGFGFGTDTTAQKIEQIKGLTNNVTVTF
jgi:hypothetical protein